MQKKRDQHYQGQTSNWHNNSNIVIQFTCRNANRTQNTCNTSLQRESIEMTFFNQIKDRIEENKNNVDNSDEESLQAATNIIHSHVQYLKVASKT